MKKICLAIGCVVLIMALWSSAQAIPFVTGSYNGVFFRNSEVFLNNDGSIDPASGRPTVTAGDTFWGILSVQNIINAGSDTTGQTGPNIWSTGQVPEEITGYFATDVMAAGGGVVILGPAAVDPNGILAGNAVMQLYEDFALNNFDNSSIANGLATATDGVASWLLGMGPSTDEPVNGPGYWYSLAPQIIPATGPVGVSYAGLNFINPNGLGFASIDDPNEVNLNTLVELWFNSEIFVLPGGGSAAGLFDFGSNDPAVFYPVPEPATMLLLGSGLLGLAGAARRRLFKKD